MTPPAADARGYKTVVTAVPAAEPKPSTLAGDGPASTEYRESQ
jgi:hypothetical protein